MYRCICIRKTETYDSCGKPEFRRYIDKGDHCRIGAITPGLLIEVHYPTPDGERRAYLKSLQNFSPLGEGRALSAAVYPRRHPK